jgi:hypothetical protein
VYVLRTSVGESRLDNAGVVHSYKLLAHVERAFRGFKAVDLQVRPIHHWAEKRVRAHILLCMLAYYVQWHLERAWAPLLFRDEDRPVPVDPVAPAMRSAAAQRKARAQRTDEGTPVHSFKTLLAELATQTRPDNTFEVTAEPTPLQNRALTLLDLTSGMQPERLPVPEFTQTRSAPQTSV